MGGWNKKDAQSIEREMSELNEIEQVKRIRKLEAIQSSVADDPVALIERIYTMITERLAIPTNDDTDLLVQIGTAIEEWKYPVSKRTPRATPDRGRARSANKTT